MENHKLAVLIDADNAQASRVAALLAEAAKYGIAIVKRAYGDWTTSQLKGWKDVLHLHAIHPIQQFAYTKGKNATDSALIIDAMDLLYTGNFDGFCLVSSDSDFTRLATRLREGGKTVIGFGEQSKTPRPFIAACDKFVFTEILGISPGQENHAPQRDNGNKRHRNRKTAEPVRHGLQETFTSAIEAVARDGGWAELSAVGSFIAKNDPSFDSRNFGHSRLSQMVRKLDFLSVQETRINNKLLCEIRLKSDAPAMPAVAIAETEIVPVVQPELVSEEPVVRKAPARRRKTRTPAEPAVVTAPVEAVPAPQVDTPPVAEEKKPARRRSSTAKKREAVAPEAPAVVQEPAAEEKKPARRRSSTPKKRKPAAEE